METQKHTVKHQMVAAILAVSIMILVAVQCTSDSEPSQNDWQVESYVTTQQIVKNNLKSPSTADFPWTPGKFAFVQVDETTWQLNSYVDCQNGFGATVRTHYHIRFDVDSIGNVTNYHNLKFD